jgi:hypothetical protein
MLWLIIVFPNFAVYAMMVFCLCRHIRQEEGGSLQLRHPCGGSHLRGCVLGVEPQGYLPQHDAPLPCWRHHPQPARTHPGRGLHSALQGLRPGQLLGGPAGGAAHQSHVHTLWHRGPRPRTLALTTHCSLALWGARFQQRQRQQPGST